MEQLKYNILLVDDNPFPTKECVGVLLRKFKERFSKECEIEKIRDEQFKTSGYNDVANNFEEIRGKSLSFPICENVEITIYNYDATKSEQQNQNKIVELINKNNVNIFWTDRGHTIFKVEDDKMFEVHSAHNTNSDALFNDKIEGDTRLKSKVVEALVGNKIRQVAVYSFNPTISPREIERKRKNIADKFNDSLGIENIYFLETSPILNLFEKNDFLANGSEEDSFLGTIPAFEKYGTLLGSVLFDLFLQLNENKTKLSTDDKRYNFFKTQNRNVLRYFKLLNNENVKIKPDFNVGLVSFFGKIYGESHFLLDVPYKEYYKTYDDILKRGTTPNNSFLTIGEKVLPEDSERFIYYKYKKVGNEFKYCLEIDKKIDVSDSQKQAQNFLPLLHTAIFYQPDFYQAEKFPFEKFQLDENENFCSKPDADFCEVFYFFRKINFEGIEGVLHFAVWRRTLTEEGLFDETKENIWETFYSLIEPKVKEALITILQKLIQKQATKSAISQVMARNTSHNIGAHVMNKLVEADNLEKICTYANCLKSYKPDKDFEDATNHKPFQQIAIFNNYVKCRMDYLADISFGTPLMQTNKYAYGELFTELDKVRLLLEHISGLGEFEYKIEFKRNGKRFKASKLNNEDIEAIEDDLLVAIPNDILGTQAFYNLLENIVRNTAKHSNKSKLDGNVVFTVNFIDRIEGVGTVDNDYCNCKDANCIKAHETEIINILNDLIAVEVYDNIPVSEKHTLSSDEKKEYAAIKKEGSETAELIDKIDWLVYNQNKKLNDDILENGKLRSSSLGLVEMDASATYLRKRDVSYINHNSYQIEYNESWSRNSELNKEDQAELRGTNCRHFLKAFKKDNHLAYRFFLLRPAVVLLVTELCEDDKTRKDELKKQGIWVVTKEDFEIHLKAGKVYSHEFVVYATEEKDNIEPLINEHRTSLPIRAMEVVKKELQKLLEAQDAEGEKLLDVWEKECWKQWEVKLKSDGFYGIKEKVYIRNSMEGSCKAKEEKGCNCQKEEKFNAVILDHGKKSYQDYRYCKKVNYLDDLSSKAFEKLPRLKTTLKENKLSFYIGALNNNETQRDKLRESVLSKILVIDERVQNQIGGIYYEEGDIRILNHEVYARSGIIIPEFPVNTAFEEDKAKPNKSKFNLSANDIDEKFGVALADYIRHYTTTFKRTDFILIHYSILERVFKNEANKTAKINEFLESISGENTPQIVITSGRGGGALTELTPKVRFVNLSSVVTSFVEIKSKYFSNYLLHSSRKNNGKN